MEIWREGVPYNLQKFQANTYQRWLSYTEYVWSTLFLSLGIKIVVELKIAQNLLNPI